MDGGIELDVRVLGGVRVDVAGRRVEVSSRVVALLALLASQIDTVLPRAHVAARLWPDSVDGQARTNLRRELHHLRALVGDLPCLVAEPDGIGWTAADEVTVDVVTLRLAQQDALRALADHDGPALARATEVVRAIGPGELPGEFLPGCRDEWAVQLREELRHTGIEICDRGSGFWLTHGDPEAALTLARQLVLLEPLGETAYLRLMEVHRARGDLAGAVATYHRGASVLREELGVEPGPALRNAMADVLDEQATHSTGVSGIPVIGAGPPLVGRERELAMLHTAWGQVSTRSALVLLVGEPGIGKTRLMDELIGRVRRQHGVAARARCHVSGASLPLSPVAEWLRTPHLRHALRGLDDRWRSHVERLVPGPEPSHAAPARSAGQPTSIADAWQQVPFYEALVRVVAAVERPVLLALDDLHWCDRATLSWLGFLLSFPLGVPVLVVATARREELDDSALSGAVAAMVAAGQAQVVTVGELTEAGTIRLAEDVLGRPVGAAERALIWAATAGRPMSVVEVARAALGTVGPVRPEALHEALAHRLAALGPTEVALAELVAAVGRDVDLDLLVDASELDDRDLVRAVDRLWRARILVQHGSRYDFAHDLIREVVLAGVSPPRRWLLHRRIAQAMERQHIPGDAAASAALAEQYAAGGLPQHALPHLEDSIRAALAVFAHDDAIRLGERALQLVADEPRGVARDERELAIVLSLLAPITVSLGYASPRLEAAARQAALLAERLGRPADHVRALVTLFSCAFVQGRIAESAAFAERALGLAGAAPELAAQASFTVGGAACSLGRFEEADAHFARACAEVEPGDTLPSGALTAVHGRGWWAHNRFLLGDPGGARVCAEEAVEVARRSAQPWSLTVGLAYAAVTHQLRGDREALGRTLDELEPLCARYRFAYYDSWTVVLRGWLVGGPRGCAQVRAGIDALIAAGSFTRLPYWLWLQADVCRRAGDRTSARVALEAALTQARAHGDVWWLPAIERDLAGLAR